MNNFERRFYSEPETANIPVGYLSTAKEIFQKILNDMQGENPYASISELLSEDIEEEQVIAWCTSNESDANLNFPFREIERRKYVLYATKPANGKSILE